MSDKIRKYVLPNLPYLFVFWFFSKLGTAYRIDVYKRQTVYKGNIIKINNGLPILRRDTAQTRLRAVFL